MVETERCALGGEGWPGLARALASVPPLPHLSRREEGVERPVRTKSEAREALSRAVSLVLRPAVLLVISQGSAASRASGHTEWTGSPPAPRHHFLEGQVCWQLG